MNAAGLTEVAVGRRETSATRTQMVAHHIGPDGICRNPGDGDQLDGRDIP